MPIRQPWVDPNTGATFPISLVVFKEDRIDLADQQVVLSYLRYASASCYQAGKQPIQVVGTQIGGVTYGSWFGAVVASAQAAFGAVVHGATASYLAAAPEFSGAVFF